MIETPDGGDKNRTERTGEPECRKKSPRAYKLPSDEQILLAIYAVGSKMKTIGSQKMLIAMVRAELENMNAAFRVAPRRLRKLVIKSGYLRVEFRMKDTDIPSKNMRTCPVCGTKLRRIRNMTIYGRKTSLGHLCPTCHYSTGATRKVPVLYTFTRLVSGQTYGTGFDDRTNTIF